MDKRKGFAPVAVGVSSLLVIFAVLCLTVFAMLSMTTVQAEKRLADASVRAVADYYAADLEAEEIFARLRGGELPREVLRQGDRYAYLCPISEQQYLAVVLEKKEDGWNVLCWQAVAREDDTETETLPVWQGMEESEVTP